MVILLKWVFIVLCIVFIVFCGVLIVRELIFRHQLKKKGKKDK